MAHIVQRGPGYLLNMEGRASSDPSKRATMETNRQLWSIKISGKQIHYGTDEQKAFDSRSGLLWPRQAVLTKPTRCMIHQLINAGQLTGFLRYCTIRPAHHFNLLGRYDHIISLEHPEFHRQHLEAEPLCVEGRPPDEVTILPVLHGDHYFISLNDRELPVFRFRSTVFTQKNAHIEEKDNETDPFKQRTKQHTSTGTAEGEVSHAIDAPPRGSEAYNQRIRVLGAHGYLWLYDMSYRAFLNVVLRLSEAQGVDNDSSGTFEYDVYVKKEDTLESPGSPNIAHYHFTDRTGSTIWRSHILPTLKSLKDVYLSVGDGAREHASIPWRSRQQLYFTHEDIGEIHWSFGSLFQDEHDLPLHITRCIRCLYPSPDSRQFRITLLGQKLLVDVDEGDNLINNIPALDTLQKAMWSPSDDSRIVLVEDISARKQKKAEKLPSSDSGIAAAKRERKRKAGEEQDFEQGWISQQVDRLKRQRKVNQKQPKTETARKQDENQEPTAKAGSPSKTTKGLATGAARGSKGKKV